MKMNSVLFEQVLEKTDKKHLSEASFEIIDDIIDEFFEMEEPILDEIMEKNM